MDGRVGAPGAPALVGVLNVTPDSFSDGGRHATVEAAVEAARRMVAEGAAWIDVGGESTRPGAAEVDPAAERARVVPVIRRLVDELPDVVVSIDTRKAEVAAAALDAGARVVNDVSAGADPAMLPLVAAAGCDVVLMHMRGTPATMQADTRYGDLVGEVVAYLAGRRDAALAAGVAPARVVLDPGVGFGKAPGDNPALLRGLPRLVALGQPVLVGASRKRFVGELSGVAAPDGRVHGSVGAALAAAAGGASYLRVHDVAATREALAVFLPCLPQVRP